MTVLVVCTRNAQGKNVTYKNKKVKRLQNEYGVVCFAFFVY